MDADPTLSQVFPMKKYDILLVDDDPFILNGMGKDLEGEGYRVTTADSGEKAIKVLDENIFDLVITDLVMGAVDGIAVLKKSKEIRLETMVMILTGYGDMPSAIEALRSDADDYLLKPCEMDELHLRISICLKKLELCRKIKIYEKLLPVCCACKKVRVATDKNSRNDVWVPMEKYIREKAGLHVDSIYCPKCAESFSELGVHIDLDPIHLNDITE